MHKNKQMLLVIYFDRSDLPILLIVCTLVKHFKHDVRVSIPDSVKKSDAHKKLQPICLSWMKRNSRTEQTWRRASPLDGEAEKPYMARF